MFAIIKTGGKQILVKKNDVIYIEKIKIAEGKKIIFDKVLIMNDKIGKPLLPGFFVEGLIEKQGKQKKLIVYRHNQKSTHKRKYGHRQPYTRVRITGMKG